MTQPKRSDEIEFYVGLRKLSLQKSFQYIGRRCVYELASSLEINHKRAAYLLHKWSNNGWFTDESPEVLTP